MLLVNAEVVYGTGHGHISHGGRDFPDDYPTKRMRRTSDNAACSTALNETTKTFNDLSVWDINPSTLVGKLDHSDDANKPSVPDGIKFKFLSPQYCDPLELITGDKKSSSGYTWEWLRKYPYFSFLRKENTTYCKYCALGFFKNYVGPGASPDQA